VQHSMPDPDHDPTDRLLDLIREAGNLIRDGSTDQEREQFFTRKAALLAELDAEDDQSCTATRTRAGAPAPITGAGTNPRWCTSRRSGPRPGRGLDINLVDIGSRGDALDPVIRLHFGGAPRAELLALTEARRLSTTLVELAARADAG
jgi:hypothetical protein